MMENFINNYEYYKNISLKRYNTYNLESYADYLIFPTNEELINLLQFLKEKKIKYIILGGGSNIILAKPNYDVVIKLDWMNNTIKDNIVVAEAGVSLIKLANLCMNNNLDGLSFAGGIPGLVGASTAMPNAGAYNEDMSMIVKEVKVITPDMEIKTLQKRIRDLL